MEIKSRIWIEKDGEPFLGFGRIKLLKMIDDKLSINAAAKELVACSIQLAASLRRRRVQDEGTFAAEDGYALARMRISLRST